jgi:predicted NBD/HSP70 family sugar kinase
LPASHVLVGAGAAVAGITRRSDGFVHLAPNLGWRDIPLAPMLASELGLGILVLAANEADLGALAEHRRVRPGVGNLIYVSGEVGIGAGVIRRATLINDTARPGIPSNPDGRDAGA